MDINSEITMLSSSVDNLYNQVDKFIKDNPIPSMASFEEATTRKGLYTHYMEVVEISNGLATYLSDVESLLMIRAQFKRMLIINGYPTSLVSKYNAVIDEISERIGIITRKLNVYKSGIENQLRFYQSVQYIMSSPRLNSYE
jgi:hypothetical protein